MSDVERIAPGQRIWRHPNEEPPQRRAPDREPPQGEKPEDGQEPPKEDEADDGHIDVFVRPPVTALPSP